MKFFFLSFTITVIVFLCSCSATNKKIEKINSICIKTTYPLINPDGRKQIIVDSTCLYNYNGYNLFQLPYRYILEDENKVLKDEIRYKYFLLTNTSTHGVIYDSIFSKSGIVAKADTILRGLSNFTFDTICKLSTLYKITENTNKNELLEVYIPKKIATDNIEDTAFMYYAKLYNEIKYSFSPNLDRLKGMKLFKIRLVYNSKYSESFKMHIPSREIIFEFSKIDIKNENDIINFIKVNSVVNNR